MNACAEWVGWSCQAYADAQFDYTGYSFPLGVLHQFVDDPDDPDPLDQAALIAEGRAAYLRV